MKICSKCKVEKELVDFSRHKSKKNGRRSYCKACDKAYKVKNKEKIAVKNKAHYEANKEKVRAKNKAYYEDNKEKIRVYYETNLGAYNARVAKRRAAKLQRTPHWLTEEDHLDIKAFYVEARRFTKETGIHHHVDHIHPLQGKAVSGLHCPLNLQILTATENLQKNNSFEGED